MESIQEKLNRLKATMASKSIAVSSVIGTGMVDVIPLNNIVPTIPTPAQQHLLSLMAAKRAQIVLESTPINNPEIIQEETTISTNTLENNTSLTGIDKSGHSIQYNHEQLDFIQTASRGEDCILIGAAGTGKTTCMRGAVSSLIESGIVPPNIPMDAHKYLLPNTYGIALVSFTRRAVSNLRKAMSQELKSNCLTIHSLLEYEPQYFDVYDPETGDTKSTMNFQPTRGIHHKLPEGIKTIVIDEASMVSTELFQQLVDATYSNTQFIFLGDIQQLPPVFGAAILGYKMLELKTIELTQVYRQALESPIIRLAHRILSGNPIGIKEYPDWKYPDQLTIHPWKKKLDSDTALITLAKFLTTAIDSGLYNKDDDMILIPYNKACGTIELNKHIANHIARKGNLITHEIIAGFNKLYLSEGDKVLFDKEDGIVTKIVSNTLYTGLQPVPASATLDYWGCEQVIEGTNIGEEHRNKDINSEEELDLLLSMTAATSDEDRVRKASHKITIKLLDSDREIEVDSAAQLNGLILSYALTVHKSQGSEWRKVFLLLHQSHNTMLQRELLYTAVTRAREELYVICEPESFTKGITSQRIKGNTLAEKALFFMGKKEQGN